MAEVKELVNQVVKRHNQGSPNPDVIFALQEGYGFEVHDDEGHVLVFRLDVEASVLDTTNTD